ncbi:hypothetical protein [Neolewinella xylanilytica]|uniref:hypothetical protein n=1 Tax=Neolewinella xylanilytica TaxID=1514080 RepID=UPI000CEAE94B|nr:hypothetical protein [Neolewinella xylanilytica]
MENYWQKFDELIDLLKKDNKHHVVDELKDAQLYVNGLTDGWYNFMEAYDNIIKFRKQELTEHQLNISSVLSKKLKDWLSDR